ncbi:hypothetical protein D3C72_1995560 [compost metagenome]
MKLFMDGSDELLYLSAIQLRTTLGVWLHGECPVRDIRAGKRPQRMAKRFGPETSRLGARHRPHACLRKMPAATLAAGKRSLEARKEELWSGYEPESSVIASRLPASSRNRNFWIFPVPVFGSAP